MAELSEKAQAICAKHYSFKSRASCNSCPLIKECHNPSRTATQVDLDAWRDRVNVLAEQTE